MSENVKLFVEVISRVFPVKGRVIEVGSLCVPCQENFADLRRFFPNQAYIGCDIAQSPRVARIENAEQLTFKDNYAVRILKEKIL